MKLQSLSYTEGTSQGNANFWKVEDLILGKSNLIIGKNATGKTRIINLINNLAIFIRQPYNLGNGEWSLKFSFNEEIYFYYLKCENKEIVKETIEIDGVTKLHREKNSAEIYSETQSNNLTISPPSDKLVLHVRRDVNEFPFLEELANWAESVRGFSFGNTSPYTVEIPGNPLQLTSLNAVPSALEKLSPKQKYNVLEKFQKVGYYLEDASTDLAENAPSNIKIVIFKEKGIANPLKQMEISQGMFRAFAILTIIEMLKAEKSIGCVLIDDLGEGLDSERSKNLAIVIYNDIKESNIQLITTSNDASLTNTFPLTDITVCIREGSIVKCKNYSNAKEKFDEWQQLSLNNFDLLTSNFLYNDA